MLSNRPTLDDIKNARILTESLVRKTPVLTSNYFNDLLGMELFFKCENFQKTGSFKIRGASNAIFSLNESESKQGVACQSSGNHGGAIACAAHLKGIHADIVMAKSVSKAKIHNVKTYNGNMIFCDTMAERDELFLKTVEDNNRISIHPYDNYSVMAGQGTIGVEIESQIDKLDGIIVAVGGGGLIGGIGSYLKSVWPDIQVIGCSPENSAVMIHSIKTEEILDLESKPTLSDGTAGGVEKESITFPICKDIIDQTILVSETEIQNGMLKFLENERMLLEGAAGTAVAALIKMKDELKGKKVGVVICGGNISLDVLKKVLK